ncbi:auxin-responsive protein SAUR36-like [Cynara cardunculus var. scolymus]|uniref:Auxin responsive SAUR protein n=1 Tax=Cynara cardunculus var. scolymus TaxID=59895 RepID=A0A118JWY3_CYNCS|nr:auxin-responsive protein SAUR36-like [Cynara cardunculus var. scolymus]KVH95501.1 Auxin responsive SAUR protein [Cynara cardunculus var. scolymus]
MNKIRGFRIRHKLVKLIKRGLHRRQIHSDYLRLNPPTYTARAISKLCGFARSLKKNICCRISNSNYIRLGEEEQNPIPKGHLAVYVGEKEDAAHRVLVPVIYFNHPLFGDLLREAEKVYGFNHHGGIHVPCRISEFENVQTKINAAGGCGGSDGFRPRRSWRLTL